jgi:hypothetical protein
MGLKYVHREKVIRRIAKSVQTPIMSIGTTKDIPTATNTVERWRGKDVTKAAAPMMINTPAARPRIMTSPGPRRCRSTRRENEYGAMKLASYFGSLGGGLLKPLDTSIP